MRTGVFMGVDLGGTGAKAGVFDGRGRLLGFGQESFHPEVSPEGHAEIDIEELYARARSAARAALRRSGASRVTALAVSSQGQTFVSLDGKDRPLHRAILWYDSRGTACARRLAEAVDRACGRGPRPLVTPIATASKILWLRETSPGRMKRARRFLLLPDYFAYRLTGEAVTDYHTAGSTALYCEATGRYEPAALEATGVGLDQVARVAIPGTVIGPVRAKPAAEWGLSPETTLICGTNDQYAGALGAGNCRPGILSVTTGTCLSLVTLTKRLPRGGFPPGLYGGSFPIPGLFFYLAFSKTAGLVLNWFRDRFGEGKTLSDLDECAAGVPIGSRGLTAIPHFDGMISPAPDPSMRGALAGLTLQHGPAEIYRALLESLAFSLRENLERLRGQGVKPEIIRAIGGGARSDVWLRMMADVTGRPVERPEVTEAAVLGAAMLAALGAGVFHSLAESSHALYRRRALAEPSARNRALYESPYRRYLALCRGLHGSPSGG